MYIKTPSGILCLKFDPCTWIYALLGDDPEKKSENDEKSGNLCPMKKGGLLGMRREDTKNCCKEGKNLFSMLTVSRASNNVLKLQQEKFKFTIGNFFFLVISVVEH